MWIVCVSFSSAADYNSSQLEQDIEETRELLQKGLNIFELDQEIKRLALKEQQLQDQTNRINEQLHVATEHLQQKKAHVGNILRAYYMGERESLYLQLFKMNNLADALAALEFLQMIFQHDHQVLLSYQKNMQVLKENQQQLQVKQEELRELKQAFIDQRDRLAQLELELEENLASVPASTVIRAEIADLTKQWQTEGLPLFRRYFSALAEVMPQLPEIIDEDEDSLVIRGSEMTFKLTEFQLNQFLREKNDIFDPLTFHFEQGRLLVTGKQDDMSFYLQGRYEIEHEPKHRIHFIVDTIRFNHLDLPDTTISALEDEFDLSLYPDQFQIKVKAENVLIEDGMMSIDLKVKESWLDSILDGLF